MLERARDTGNHADPDPTASDEIDLADISDDGLLDEALRLQREQARLAARELDVIEEFAVRRFRDALELAHAAADLNEAESNATPEAFVLDEARQCVIDELVLATGLPFAHVRAQVDIATTDHPRHAPIREALAAGELSFLRARAVSERAACLPAELMPALLEKVLAPYPAGDPNGRGGLLVPHRVFTARLARFVARHDENRAAHREAVANRDAHAHVNTDTGTGTVSVSGHAGRVTAAIDRIERVARAVRRAGDERTLAQLRSDIALDLLLHGALPESLAGQMPAPYTPTTLTPASFTAPTTAMTSPETSAFGPAATPVREQESRAGAPVHPTDQDLIRMAPYTGALPPARVTVTVSAASLLGATDEPGTLDAAGNLEYLPAHVIRDLAYAAGSVWRRLVTDPATGYMADLSTHAYAVTGHLRERVMARDRVSRVPGAVTPAWRCDLDHDLDFHAGGPSSESNLSAKSRHGHNHKTRGTWTTRREPGVHGLIRWTTGTGRTYEIRPWDYRDPDEPTADEMLNNLAGPEPDPDELPGAGPSQRSEQSQSFADAQVPNDDTPPISYSPTPEALEMRARQHKQKVDRERARREADQPPPF